MDQAGTTHVVIVGGGFAGINAAKTLGWDRRVRVTLIDRRNYHLFQPLLYQVAMAGLSPAEIAAPIRHILTHFENIRVLLGNVQGVDLQKKILFGDFGEMAYDRLILACGATHSYFGRDYWEEYAPGLKTLEQATEIRRRVLTAFEEAERENDHEKQKKLLTFVIVGGGPTGVELAGALGEISRNTLTKDFHNIDSRRTRIILIEAGSRILPSFDPSLSAKASRDLEKLGVTVWTQTKVQEISANGVRLDKEQIYAATVLWAAGVAAPAINATLGVELDNKGRVFVENDLTIPHDPHVFVLGDQAHCKGADGNPLPGVSPVAIQQGIHTGKNISRELRGRKMLPFRYFDKGQMATIGRSKAIAQINGFRFSGFLAWLTWLVVHIYYLIGFKNRFFVLFQWLWAYISYGRGARLIVEKEWRNNQTASEKESAHATHAS